MCPLGGIPGSDTVLLKKLLVKLLEISYKDYVLFNHGARDTRMGIRASTFFYGARYNRNGIFIPITALTDRLHINQAHIVFSPGYTMSITALF